MRCPGREWANMPPYFYTCWHRGTQVTSPASVTCTFINTGGKWLAFEEKILTPGGKVISVVHNNVTPWSPVRRAMSWCPVDFLCPSRHDTALMLNFTPLPNQYSQPEANKCWLSSPVVHKIYSPDTSLQEKSHFLALLSLFHTNLSSHLRTKWINYPLLCTMCT
jgi:hypothetical protein